MLVHMEHRADLYAAARRETDSERYREAAISRFHASWTEAPDSDCWLWTRTLNHHGYGKINFLGMTVSAHRAAYYLLVGEVPAGMELDHLCRVRHCVNPAHLEPVTRRVNLLRGRTPAAANAAKSHCSRGHELTPDNLLTNELKRGARSCRQCHNARNLAAWRRRAAGDVGAKR